MCCGSRVLSEWQSRHTLKLLVVVGINQMKHCCRYVCEIPRLHVASHDRIIASSAKTLITSVEFQQYEYDIIIVE